MFDSVTSSAFHSPGTVYIIEEMIHTSGSSSCSGSCQVIAILPQDTEHAPTTFGELYNAQLDKKSAIYHQLSCNSSTRYAITAPNYYLMFQKTDIAFVMVGQYNDLV